MQTTNTPSNRGSQERDAAAIVLGLAKRLHRCATSSSLEAALPVLRRVLASDTLRGLSLPELYRRRSMVQRKHLLRTLAIEAGYPAWEAYRAALTRMTSDELEHFDVLRVHAGYPNQWFSSPEDAREHAARSGGRVVRVGTQAVVVGD